MDGGYRAAVSVLDEIGLDELVALLRARAPVVLVDALPPIAFAASHLPGAINMPEGSVDGIADRRLPDRDALIVVYCANPQCESSVVVAQRLVALGYTGVRHFSDGKDGWRDAGLELEGGRVARAE
jgi:rhodanese-related sulfurtransferase